MPYFNFDKLIEQYSRDVTITVPGEGHYGDNGDWIDGIDETVTVFGAVINFRESKVFRSEGTLTTQDKRLFTLEPLRMALKGSVAVFNGNKYNIEDNTENAEYTGVYAYTLRYNSAFKAGDKSD